MAIRSKFHKQIEDLQNAISYNDEMYVRTGDPNFAKFRDDCIKQLCELKEYILEKEKKEK